VVPQPQTYLGAHQQITAAQLLLLTVFIGLAVQLPQEVHLLVLVVLLPALHTLSRFMQPIPQVQARVQQAILSLLQPQGMRLFIQVRVHIPLLFPPELRLLVLRLLLGVVEEGTVMVVVAGLVWDITI
jgi:hypothetical protein